MEDPPLECPFSDLTHEILGSAPGPAAVALPRPVLPLERQIRKPPQWTKQCTSYC